MYTLCRTGREKFIGAEGADLWQDYNKIKFYWPGAFSTLKKKKSSNNPAVGLLFVVGAQDYASGLLLQ